MNESELKDLFVSSIESGHILDGKNRNLPFTNPNNKMRIKSEGYFGQFDLVIAILNKENCQNSESSEAYYNVLMRTGQLAEFARTEKCRIDCISFYPVELKSGCDILDVRLPNQILNGILTFGKSMIVLDRKHINRTSLKFLRLLPATIVGYTGTKDFFRVLSVFDRNINIGMFSLSKRRFAKTLGENGIMEGIERIYGRLCTLERINQKFMFNELYNSDPGFLKEEIEFLRQFSTIKTAMTYRKQVLNYIKESENDKISNYL